MEERQEGLHEQRFRVKTRLRVFGKLHQLSVSGLWDEGEGVTRWAEAGEVNRGRPGRPLWTR